MNENHELSNREWQVLLLAAKGLTHIEIGIELCIATFTVRNHMANIREKTNTQNLNETLYKLVCGELVDKMIIEHTLEPANMPKI